VVHVTRFVSQNRYSWRQHSGNYCDDHCSPCSAESAPLPKVDFELILSTDSTSQSIEYRFDRSTWLESTLSIDSTDWLDRFQGLISTKWVHSKRICFTVSKSPQKAHFVVVVIECIYKSYVFSHSVATSTAEWNHCRQPRSMGSWQVTSFSICHKGTCQLLTCCEAPLLLTVYTVALVGPEVIQKCSVASR